MSTCNCLSLILVHNRNYRYVLFDIERLTMAISNVRGFHSWGVTFFPPFFRDPQIQGLNCFECGDYVVSSNDMCDRIRCKCQKCNCELCDRVFIHESGEDEVKCQGCNGDICSECQSDNHRCYHCGDYYCGLCHLDQEDFRYCELCDTNLCGTCLEEKCGCKYYQTCVCSAAA